MRDHAERKTYIVSKELFVGSDDKARSELTYDLMQYQTDILDRLESHFSDHMDVCNNRFVKLELRKKVDTATSAVTGFFGGFVAMVAMVIFKIGG